jgi:hypothetical protein
MNAKRRPMFLRRILRLATHCDSYETDLPSVGHKLLHFVRRPSRYRLTSVQLVYNLSLAGRIAADYASGRRGI